MTFREKLADARRDLQGWERTPRAALARIGRALDAEGVRDALGFLDELADERTELERNRAATDEDTDEVHFAQQEVATALRHIPARSLPALLDGLASSRSGTRFWTAYALKYAADRASLPLIDNARKVEPDELTRRMLGEAADSVAVLPHGVLGRLVRRFRRPAN